MSRQATAAPASSAGLPGISASAPDAGSGLLGMLTPLLDRDRDRSVVNDLLGSALKMFQKGSN